MQLSSHAVDSISLIKSERVKLFPTVLSLFCVGILEDNFKRLTLPSISINPKRYFAKAPGIILFLCLVPLNLKLFYSAHTTVAINATLQQNATQQQLRQLYPKTLYQPVKFSILPYLCQNYQHDYL